VTENTDAQKTQAIPVAFAVQQAIRRAAYQAGLREALRKANEVAKDKTG
jgi:hypothetical protein